MIRPNINQKFPLYHSSYQLFFWLRLVFDARWLEIRLVGPENRVLKMFFFFLGFRKKTVFYRSRIDFWMKYLENGKKNFFFYFLTFKKKKFFRHFFPAFIKLLKIFFEKLKIGIPYKIDFQEVVSHVATRNTVESVEYGRSVLCWMGRRRWK